MATSCWCNRHGWAVGVGTRWRPSSASSGITVYAPTLTGLAERAHLASPDVVLTTHVEDVVSLVIFDDLRDIILVGTSSGGTVITGVANRIPDRIASLVYLDAFLPSDGPAYPRSAPTRATRAA